MEPTAINLYKEKSTKIISESIKSAIFIDEKAWAPYTEKSDPPASEETLSLDLYNSFKNNQISLAVHKFTNDDLSSESVKDYLFTGRDLVLLDWHLDGHQGEEYALEMLSEIVARPHIHFCCLYTSDENLDNVFHNVLSYFSEKTTEYYDDLKLDLAADEAEIKSILDTIRSISANRDNEQSKNDIKQIFGNHKDLIQRIRTATGEQTPKCALIKTGVAFSDLKTSSIPRSCPELVSFEQKVLVIESTIVVILKKNYSTDPAELIERITDHVINSKSSFTQLLGLEMQNIFDRCGSFIDSNLIEVSVDALLKHRAQLQSEGLHLPFEYFIKDVLLVQASSNVSNQKLELLDDTLLDGLYDENKEVKIEELLYMNTFYNSIYLPMETEKRIDFGQVFKHSDKEEYFICITPKSDCLRPLKKIKNSFYFVKGLTMKDKKKALKLGDTAIISFIGREVINWTEPSLEKDSGISRYLPLYAKPVSYTLPKTEYKKEDKIEFFRLDDKGAAQSFTVEYVTTIKHNYAQRIANHAFTHPTRVSVDFVKEIEKKASESETTSSETPEK